MSSATLTPKSQQFLQKYFQKAKQPELITTYLHYIEHVFDLHPVVFLKDKTVYKSLEEALNFLEKEDKLWRKTEIKIGHTSGYVNEETKKIYICPFTGKVFGNNTHPNPQDAIYEWVAHCPENTERTGGLRVKRFFISEDPDVISSYAEKNKPKEPITKIVFSSCVTNKLFYSKEAVIEDIKDHYIKSISLAEVPEQSRFQIETSFMEFIQDLLRDEKIAAFVESIAEVPEFVPYVEEWLGELD